MRKAARKMRLPRMTNRPRNIDFLFCRPRNQRPLLSTNRLDWSATRAPMARVEYDSGQQAMNAVNKSTFSVMRCRFAKWVAGITFSAHSDSGQKQVARRKRLEQREPNTLSVRKRARRPGTACAERQVEWISFSRTGRGAGQQQMGYVREGKRSTKPTAPSRVRARAKYSDISAMELMVRADAACLYRGYSLARRAAIVSISLAHCVAWCWPIRAITSRKGLPRCVVSSLVKTRWHPYLVLQ